MFGRNNPAPVLYCEGHDDGRELPWKFEICGTCSGHGRHSQALGAFTRDDLDELGPDWCDDYFAGRYDRACDDCDGTGKRKVADYSRMSEADREAYEQQLDDDAAIDAEHAAEIRMGC